MDLSTQSAVGYSADARAHFAARLRLYLNQKKTSGIPMAPCSISGILEETFADELPFSEKDRLEELANLIDPGVCKNVRGSSATHFTCSVCGATAPSNSIVVTDASAPKRIQIIPIQRCPFCGRKVQNEKSPFSLVKGGQE